jgi:hypothetical protein
MKWKGLSEMMHWINICQKQREMGRKARNQDDKVDGIRKSKKSAIATQKRPLSPSNQLDSKKT